MNNKISFLKLLISAFNQFALALLTLSVITSCVPVQNFTDPHSPIWTGDFEPQKYSNDNSSLRVVSFNIKYAQKIDEALMAFKNVDGLKNVDLILLQEMDTLGTIKIAEGLNMSYVYIPAVTHGKKSEYFGNSILSKRRIDKYEKIILPHHAKSGRQRIAGYSVIDFNGSHLHIYNAHLETMAMKRKKRADQLRAILEHCKTIPPDEPILIAGDFNSFFPKDRKLFASIMKESGFIWDSKDIKYTSKALKGLIKPHIDQVYSRGLFITNLGVATHVKASDHFPVYFDIQIKQ